MPVSSPTAPIVAVYNNLETFYPFLKRAGDPDLIQKRKFYGDRGLFWLGERKLLIASMPVPGSPEICRRWGYRDTTIVSPANPTHQLSLDILREPELTSRIVEHAGANRTVQLVPYATTAEFLELAETLRTRYCLTVSLPESPCPENLWLRDFLDTKAGFRDLVSQSCACADLFPPGFVCQNSLQAADAVGWFLARGEGSVVKANRGKSGLGHVIFPAGTRQGQSALETLQQNPFLCNDLVIVEKYIQSPAQLSPSLEFFVPPVGRGQPQVTYVSKQLFTGFGCFAGVFLDRNLERASWYPILAERGQKIAEHLQELGYVGHFDLDAIVDDRDHPYLLETNARRTGGTHVHEFARFTFGPDYLKRVALLSINSMESGGITSFDVLLDWLADFLYPTQRENTGLVMMATSSLAVGKFGCILIAPNEAELLSLNQAVSDRLTAYRTNGVG